MIESYFIFEYHDEILDLSTLSEYKFSLYILLNKPKKYEKFQKNNNELEYHLKCRNLESDIRMKSYEKYDFLVREMQSKILSMNLNNIFKEELNCDNKRWLKNILKTSLLLIKQKKNTISKFLIRQLIENIHAFEEKKEMKHDEKQKNVENILWIFFSKTMKIKI